MYRSAIIAFRMKTIRRVAALGVTIGVLLSACAKAVPTSTATASLPRLLTTDIPGPTAATGPQLSTPDALVPIDLHVGSGVGNNWYEMYFTDPANPAGRQYSGGIDGPLVAAIDAARLSVHAAMYSFTLNSVRYALIRAHRRGIDVRVVMESDNLDGNDPQALMQAGITVLGDRQEGLMHDKFMVIDRAEVWTGSMNFTDSGVYEDNNTLLRIRSEKLADAYETEFADMFVDDLFGPARLTPTSDRQIIVGPTILDVYFSPEDHVEDALVPLLNAAKTSIYFLAYSFTSDPLGEAVRERAAAGVKVAGVMDADQFHSNLGTEYDAFRAEGLAVRLDRNPGQMHEKLIIIDGQIVVVGSYNFTRSADTTNDENLLVIQDPQIAAQATVEFTRVYSAAKP